MVSIGDVVKVRVHISTRVPPPHAHARIH